ncbi:MAG TPA: choice-of-anchor V domain-containing protein [Bryobacteraceae bacterium]|nr:choice-of-anchor V domain-containing protein [Bryobacteraceae bacterium]
MRKLLFIRTSFLLAAAPFLAHGYEYGPDPRYTGAPGDNKTACISSGCHAGTVNSGPSGLNGIKIILPNGATTYVPGQTMAISVQVIDATKAKFGFEMTARLLSNLSQGQAGDFSTTDALTQVICDVFGTAKQNGSLCPTQNPVQFIEHSLQGFNASTSGSYTFHFNWTPPASASAGNVVFYVAANAGPAGPPVQSPTNVYTTNITLTPAAATNGPAITPSGVVSHGTSSTTVEPGSWVDIYGSNLAPQTPNGRFWNASTEIINGVFPTSLDGVSVKINGKSAAVYYISPTLVVVQSPDDSGTGSVPVTVTTSVGTSTGVTATVGAVSPAFFTFDGFKYVAAEIPDADGSGYNLPGTQSSYDFLGPPEKLGFTTRSAKKGDIVELFVTGFGPTNPVTPAGSVVAQPAPSTASVTINIGGVTQTATAYLTYAGLYQINVTIPQNIGSGDIPVFAIVNGVQSQPSTTVISVQ